MTSYSPRIDNIERNLIIGGNFDLWQRGTTFNGITDGKYSADRFLYQQAGTQSINITQSTDVPTQSQSGFNSLYSLKLTVGTAGAAAGSSNYSTLSQRIEGQDYQQIHGRKVRFQFWVKASLTGTYPIAFRHPSGTRSYVTTFVVSSANTWQKSAVDLQLDTSGGWNFDNTVGLSVAVSPSVGTTFQAPSLNTWLNGNYFGAAGQVDFAATLNATLQFSQVMLIPQDFTLAGASNVDIPFQRAGRTIGHELQLAQRYYEKLEPQGLQMSITSFQANQERNWYSWKVTKRATPVVVATSPNIFLSGVSTAASSPDFSNADANGVLIIFNNTLPVDNTRMITIATMTADAEM